MLDFWVQSMDHEVYDEIIGLQMIEVEKIETSQRGIFSMKGRWE